MSKRSNTERLIREHDALVDRLLEKLSKQAGVPKAAAIPTSPNKPKSGGPFDRSPASPTAKLSASDSKLSDDMLKMINSALTDKTPNPEEESQIQPGLRLKDKENKKYTVSDLPSAEEVQADSKKPADQRVALEVKPDSTGVPIKVSLGDIKQKQFRPA